MRWTSVSIFSADGLSFEVSSFFRLILSNFLKAFRTILRCFSCEICMVALEVQGLSLLSTTRASALLGPLLGRDASLLTRTKRTFSCSSPQALHSRRILVLLGRIRSKPLHFSTIQYDCGGPVSIASFWKFWSSSSTFTTSAQVVRLDSPDTSFSSRHTHTEILLSSCSMIIHIEVRETGFTSHSHIDQMLHAEKLYELDRESSPRAESLFVSEQQQQRVSVRSGTAHRVPTSHDIKLLHSVWIIMHSDDQKRVLWLYGLVVTFSLHFLFHCFWKHTKQPWITKQFWNTPNCKTNTKILNLCFD